MKKPKVDFYVSSRLEGSEKFVQHLRMNMPDEFKRFLRLDFESNYGGFTLTLDFFDSDELSKDLVFHFYAESTRVWVQVVEKTCYRKQDYKIDNKILDSMEFEEFHQKYELKVKKVSYNTAILRAYNKAREFMEGHIRIKLGSNSEKFINSL